MSSEHTLRKLIPQKTAEANRTKKHNREASSPERVRGIVEGETVPNRSAVMQKKSLGL